MAKLYPPKIDGVLPSFYTTYAIRDNETDTTDLTVPFSLNKSVGKKEIKGFALKIKTIQNSSLICTKLLLSDESYRYDLENDRHVSFDVSDIEFTPGQFYKVQIAFVNSSNQIGYYSTVGVIKYTIRPEVYFHDIDKGGAIHQYVYTGVFNTLNRDVTEKLYSSQFILRNSNDEILEKSDIIIHDSSEDEAYEAKESYSFYTELEDNKYYSIEFIATTVNNLKVSSGIYRIIKATTTPPEIDAELEAELNEDNGFIKLSLKGYKDYDGEEPTVTGQYVICRAASNDSNAWREIGVFALKAQKISHTLWKDYTVEQGVSYKYSLQQYNDYGLYSDRMISNSVLVDFEDSFLYDGKRQLKIKFNPKVSSFKVTVLEQKTNTIGSKYPFIMRNGKVHYHEFPISGLISYLSDESQTFIDKDLLGLEEKTFRKATNSEDEKYYYEGTDLNSYNIKAERIFKREVLEWLNNGEPKIFRSPTEGNFIVRLLNTSLTPNDTVGRMIHSFSTTAEEISDYKYNELIKYGFIIFNPNEMEDENGIVKEQVEKITRWVTVELAGRSPQLDGLLGILEQSYSANCNVQFNEELYYRLVNSNLAEDLSQYFDDGYVLQLGSEIKVGKYKVPRNLLSKMVALKGHITYASGKINTRTAYSIDIRNALPGTAFTLDGEKIIIGSSGSYHIDLEGGIKNLVVDIEQPYLYNPTTLVYEKPIGTVTYSYLSELENSFASYNTIEAIDVPDRMWMGALNQTYYDSIQGGEIETNDIMKLIVDIKTSINHIFSLRLSQRYVQPIFYRLEEEKYTVINENTGKEEEKIRYVDRWYWDMDCKISTTLDNLNEAYLYSICTPRPADYYDFIQWSQYHVDANYGQGYYVLTGGKRIDVFTGVYIDGKDNTSRIQHNKDISTAVLNGNSIRLDANDGIYVVDSENILIDSLEINPGVVCQMSYQISRKTYQYEVEDYSITKGVYDIYNSRLNQLNELRASAESIEFTDNELEKFILKYNSLSTLTEASYRGLIQQLTFTKSQREEALS